MVNFSIYQQIYQFNCFKFFIHYYIPSYHYNRGIFLRPLSNKFKTFTKYRILYCKNLFFFWRKNLKQNILLWLPVMILFIFCLINLYILPFMPETFFRSLTLCIQFLILLLLQGFLIYAFFLPDQYRTTLKYTVKNAVILTFKYLPATFYVFA